MTSKQVPQQQTAAVVRDFSILQPPWGLRVEADYPVPAPGPGEVLIRMRMAACSTYDNYMHYPKDYFDADPPAVPGTEGEHLRLLRALF